MNFISLLVATVASLAMIAQTDLAVQCEENGDITYGNLTDYINFSSRCKSDSCQCYVFELQCQERYLQSHIYTLKSLSYS